MAWVYFESILFVAHAPFAPVAADWAEFMSEVQTHTGIRGVVILANNSRLSPLQRAEIQRWYETNKVRGALVTDSKMMRGIVTAMNWFGVDMRAFAPDRLHDALEFIGLPGSGREDARVLIEKLQKAVMKKAGLVAS